jgi:lipopolysaccharide/colanic/teichoic acid biosynthesis glycosyltransferase
MISTRTLPATTLEQPPEENPTFCGLTPVQIHDRYWAARGVQVVRRGDRSEIVADAELFLLTDPRILVVFRMRALVDTLSWLQPDVVWLRLIDRRDHGYTEHAQTDLTGRFTGYNRDYGSADSRRARIVVTSDRQIARLWQNAETTRDGWQMLRRSIPRRRRLVHSMVGRVYDRKNAREVMQALRRMMDVWSHPSSTIPGMRRVHGKVWSAQSARVAPDVEFIGPAWVGAGRRVESPSTVVGPAILWDDPEARPEVTNIEWLELEPSTPEIARRVRGPSRKRQLLQRGFDIIFALFALALTLPLYPFIALAIMIEDGWPIFFAHQRETMGQKPFPCLKFRSMRKDADDIKARLVAENQVDGPQFYIDTDPRITYVGRVLRKLQLDEIPQFWNVLLGQMSVVGPRPSPYKENQYCPAWRETRLSVRPGVTGLWQVMRTRRSGMDFQEWIRYDIEYVERFSLRLDLWIICQTVRYLLGVR